jgi:WD repeat and SOF domain-containing protein 1
MQRLTSVLWTKDNKYIISGSDEMNIRIWKAKAWEKLGIVSATPHVGLMIYAHNSKLILTRFFYFYEDENKRTGCHELQ